MKPMTVAFFGMAVPRNEVEKKERDFPGYWDIASSGELHGTVKLDNGSASIIGIRDGNRDMAWYLHDPRTVMELNDIDRFMNGKSAWKGKTPIVTGLANLASKIGIFPDPARWHVVIDHRDVEITCNSGDDDIIYLLRQSAGSLLDYGFTFNDQDRVSCIQSIEAIKRLGKKSIGNRNIKLLQNMLHQMLKVKEPEEYQRFVPRILLSLQEAAAAFKEYKYEEINDDC